MTPTSMGHNLTKRDPANGAPCPMERLADRMNDCPKPKWLHVDDSYRWACGEVTFTLHGTISSPDQIDDLINFLARVKG